MEQTLICAIRFLCLFGVFIVLLAGLAWFLICCFGAFVEFWNNELLLGRNCKRDK